MAKIVVEKGNTIPLAVVYRGGELGAQLKRILEKERLRVILLEEETAVLPIWERPDYVFCFSEQEEDWGDARILRIKIKGKIKEDQPWLENWAKRIIKAAFGSKVSEFLVYGEGVDRIINSGKTKSVEEVIKTLEHHKNRPKHKNLLINGVILGFIFLLLVPFLYLVSATALGFLKTRAAVVALKEGKIQETNQFSKEATGYFSTAKETIKTIPLPILDRYFNFLIFGERVADLTQQLADFESKAEKLTTGEIEAKSLRLDLGAINQNMGIIEAQADQILTARAQRLLEFFGVRHSRLVGYREEISEARRLINQADEFLGVVDEIIPTTIGVKKTYLMVLQNSAELRPTGGFIGSYALVSFEAGRLSNYKVYDIYSADGQLKGFVSPPDEILHFLGQPSWFMRDANWAVDWPLTAKRLEWFLEKETGVRVDGVVAFNLGAVQKILRATGPLFLPNRQETVTADNFFEKAEFASEINFFPGSDQKPQFLAQVAEGLFAQIGPGMRQALTRSLAEKDVMVYLNSEIAEKLMVKNGWGGALVAKDNGVMLVEANFGANKANYFLKRSIRVDSVIGKAGEVDTTLIVKYRNESPSVSWPGGTYKNYLRILVPKGAVVEKFDLGDKKEATVSTVLTADVLKSVLPNQFLVFSSREEPYDSYGTFFEVLVGGEKTIKFRFRPKYKLDFTQTQLDFTFNFLKQSGAGNDLLDFSLDYPSFLKPNLEVERNVSVLALAQKLIYNTELSQDREIKVKFKRQ